MNQELTKWCQKLEKILKDAELMRQGSKRQQQQQQQQQQDFPLPDLSAAPQIKGFCKKTCQTQTMCSLNANDVSFKRK